MSGQSVPGTVPSLMTGQRLGAYGFRPYSARAAWARVQVARHEARSRRRHQDPASAFTRDPDRLARFAREARMLAALNHPYICTIYGLEEAAGVQFLVLEPVEGVTRQNLSAVKATARGCRRRMP